MCNGWWGDIHRGEDIAGAGEGRVAVRGNYIALKLGMQQSEHIYRFPRAIAPY